ncbi:MAG: hypothetical protein ASARMPRED_008206 [Alectoria sarmentosa]|nr:MAG: hypothetical protein ASARMPRED_008206 [Alectoria sarmentosa]
MRISQLYDAALARPGNKDPFLAWWERITDRHTQLASEMQTAVFDFKSLEAQLDGSVSKVEEWMEQFDVAVYAMARWAFELQGALAVDQVQKFVAEEEVATLRGMFCSQELRLCFGKQGVDLEDDKIDGHNPNPG